eukprot:TRINITY_DN5371_c0_g1_i3.p1 TRINITY_DN5371_c0_g1~~TRINITY_DN5371_c0_g1_i3.p1  ORF type:complete len:230 (-),score=28.21 TRINITY_DN5371_c0_g1_i3:242-931(-)
MGDVFGIVILVLSVLLGLMFSIFTILNAFADVFPKCFGSFGVRFIYEMDEVMGGQLGIPHYSKVEALLLLTGSVGAWISIFTDGLLIPCIGFTCGMVYMIICALYGAVTGTGAGPFLAVAALAATCLFKHTRELVQLASMSKTEDETLRFGSSGSAQQDLYILEIFAVVMAVLTVLSGVIMQVRNTEERAKFNKQFCKVKRYCEVEKTDFVWLPGKDAPEGFDENMLLE